MVISINEEGNSNWTENEPTKPHEIKPLSVEEWNLMQEQMWIKDTPTGIVRDFTIEFIDKPLEEVNANMEYLSHARKRLRELELKNLRLAKQVKIEEDDELSEIKMEVRTFMLQRARLEATEAIVGHILKGNHIHTTRDDKIPEVWIYKEGIYVPQGRSYIMEICRDILGKFFTTQTFNEIVRKIESDTMIEPEDFFNQPHKEDIAVNNGILNIISKELKPFNPDRIFFNKLPMDYDKAAQCPHVEKHFKTVLSKEEDALVFFELAGYCLYKDYRFEKAVMLVGNGRNGKGKTLTLLKHFLGPANCTSVPLSQLTPGNTSVSELHGRLANLAGDLSNTDLKDVGMFKQLTGRDLITGKRKYLRDLFFTNYAKMIFACNELPKVWDASVGFWSRWILFEFPYQFIKAEEFYEIPLDKRDKYKIMDEGIVDKLTTKQELSGFLNKALEGLDRLMKNRKFSYSKGTEEIKSMWIRKANSFMAYCMDELIEDTHGQLSKKMLRWSFHKYCREHKIKGCSDREIKATLESEFGVVDSYDGQEAYWEGVKLKTFPKLTNNQEFVKFKKDNRARNYK